jgi:hypothetical protein
MTGGGLFGRAGPVFCPLVFTADLGCTTGEGSRSSLVHETHVRATTDYPDRFLNLHSVGGGGPFRYYSMDHAIRSGLEAARRILAQRPPAKRSPNPSPPDPDRS